MSMTAKKDSDMSSYIARDVTPLERRFALSPTGARDLKRGILYSTLLNLTFILPSVFVFIFFSDFLRPAFGRGEAKYGWQLYLILALAFTLVTAVISYLQYSSTFMAVYRESADRRIRVAEKLRRLPLSFFGRHDLSDLTSTVMADNTELEHTFSHAVPQLFASIISVVLITLSLCFYDWRLSVALLAPLPLVVLIVLVTRRMLRGRFQESYRLKRQVTEDIQQGLENIREIKAYRGEQAYLRALDHSLNVLEEEMIRDELLASVCMTASVVLLRLGLAFVAILGASLLQAGTLDLIAYLVFLVFGSSVYIPIEEVLNYSILLSYLDVRISRVRQIEEMPVQTGKAEVTIRRYDIAFDHVSFAYEPGREVLHDISFAARQGEVTALVGPSGGGKSTIAKLAARFWDIEEGRITLGGRDISQIDPEALLAHFAIVFQDVVLFNASVMDNIRIGRSGATDEEVIEAARLARCEEFVSQLPEGYDTLIGENGQKLSGGERQRISIARALLKDAPVILLDEATACLDVENDRPNHRPSYAYHSPSRSSDRPT